MTPPNPSQSIFPASALSLDGDGAELAAPTGALGARVASGWRRLTEPLHSFRVQAALIFGGLTVVLCGVVAIALGSLLTTELHGSAARALTRVTDAAAKTLANDLEQRLRETLVLANSPELWADGLDSPTVVQALARSQAAQPYSAWLGVADTTGRVMASPAGLLLGQSVAKRPWFNHGLQGAFVGDVHAALLLEKLLPKPKTSDPVRFVDFAAPIRQGGKTIGVIGVHGTWDWARDVVASLMPADAASRGMGVYIFDRGGKLLSTTAAAATGAAEVTLDALRPMPTPSTNPAATDANVVVWPDGHAYLTSIVVLPKRDEITDLGWQIVAREPVSKAFARVRIASEQTLGIGVAVAVMAGMLAWFGSGLVSQPLTTIARAARAMQAGEPGAELTVLRNNHEVQQLSSALVGMTRRLHTTIQTAPVGICQIDLGGTVLSTNDRLGELMDVGHDELLGRRFVKLIADRDQGALESHLRRLRQGQSQSVALELSFARGAAGELPVALSASMVPPMDGEDAYYVVVVEDLTQRKAAEAATRANATKTAFLSQLNHELRTPLNAIIGFSHLMQIEKTDTLSAKQQRRVEAIWTAGNHLLAMINDLLDLTLIESNRLALSLGPVSLGSVVEQSVAFVAGSAEQARLNMTVAPPPRGADADWVMADPVRLRQVLINLLSNAVKYNRLGGSVTVEWRIGREPDEVELSVIDTGRGIPAVKLDRLFEPFNRLGMETSGIQGTGIGLSITRKLVELMVGRIEVHSTLDVGSCFKVVLARAVVAPVTA